MKTIIIYAKILTGINYNPIWQPRAFVFFTYFQHNFNKKPSQFSGWQPLLTEKVNFNIVFTRLPAVLIFCLKVAAFTPLPFFIFLSFVLTLYPRLSNYTKPYFSLISSHSIAYMMMAISPLDNLLFKNSALFFTTVEPKAGFEPTTCSLQMSCSTN